MKKQTATLSLLLAFFASVLVSCEAFRPQTPTAPIPNSERKTLERVALPPDSVVFDVLLTRIPYQERELARAFWNDVDELEVEATTRKRLNEQGFRAGLVGASPPDSLSKLLTLKGRELRETIEEEVDYSKPESTNEPITSSKPVTLRQGMKSMIETRNDVYASIPILENENGALIGKSYSDARTTLSVSIEQNPDGSVRFDLSPLLKYGAPQPITRYQHGQLVRTQEQPTKSFEQLKFSVSLRPGQFLVLGATDAKTNALGKYFFTDGGEDFDQKILVLRLLVTQHDGQFDRFPDFKELMSRAHETDEDDEDSVTFASNLPQEQDDAGFDDYALETEAKGRDESSDGVFESIDIPLFQNGSDESEKADAFFTP